MKKYQLIESFGNYRHAGSKATNDATEVVSRLGFIPLYFEKIEHVNSFSNKVQRHLKMHSNWKRIYSEIEEDSVLFIQNPIYTRDYFRFSTLKKLKQRKNVRIVSLVHDVEPIRKLFNNPYYDKEFKEMLILADKLIIHNDIMRQWFTDYGVPDNKLISLEIFDYLGNSNSDKTVSFSKRIQIAGNLDKKKSAYVYQLNNLKETQFDLFGINYTGEEAENVSYHGSFSPEEVMSQLRTGFGLVWDGTELNRCSGALGEYLKYNNPHKMSLYLSSSLPVIVWKESAAAKFVEDHGVGITVSSLYELEERLSTITSDEYAFFLENVQNVQEKLLSGYYLKKALEVATKN